MIFFENKLLLQPDVVFDSESNGRNFSSHYLFIMIFYSNFRVHLNFNAQKFIDNMRSLYFSMTNDMSLDKLNKKLRIKVILGQKLKKNSQNMVN